MSVRKQFVSLCNRGDGRPIIRSGLRSHRGENREVTAGKVLIVDDDRDVRDMLAST